MEKFLESVARYIFQNYNDNLQNICLVFPNRRSGVFFNAYLRRLLNKPVIGPKILTVNDFMTGFTKLQKTDRLYLIAQLFQEFREISKTTESFDDFYFWGEVLLSDFDDIDKYLVDASSLFQNVADLKEIESHFDFLEEEQKEILRRFWGALGKWEGYKNKEEFLKLWKILGEVYLNFKMKLSASGIAFDGMIYRELAENIKEGKELFLPEDKYFIIGLNALNECEKTVFSHLRKINKGIFLWDFDTSYVDDVKNKAGMFIRENIIMFPPPEDFIFSSEYFNSEKKIDFIAVASSGAQAQVIPDSLKKYNKEFDNTAVVLANEDLLFPVLGAIPESIGSVNVTMGYPVKTSGIVGFILLLASLIKNIRSKNNDEASVYYKFVFDILNHQLLSGIETEKVSRFLENCKKKNRIYIALNELNFSELHSKIFNVPALIKNYSDYFLSVLKQSYHFLFELQPENKALAEVIVTVFKALERLGKTINDVITTTGQPISSDIYFRLMGQYLNQVSVSYEGEPLSGLQVMGVLETRCLDFENVIIIGFNEDFWPRTSVTPSYIPFNLRLAFGLPSIDNQEAIYAYYFYRLVQRAKNITAAYNTAKDGIYTGELSRLGFQLIYDSKHIIEKKNFEFKFKFGHIKELAVKSTPDIAEALLNRFTTEKPLSPSALNLYINCGYKFYLRYVAGLPEPDEISEEIDARVFGNIFHRAVEELYRNETGIITSTRVDDILKDKVRIEIAIRKAFAKEYFKVDEVELRDANFEGHSRLVLENVQTYLKQLLLFDKKYTPFEIINLEEKFVWNLDLSQKKKKIKIPIGGIIDRLDRAGDRLRAIDYKTGNINSLSFNEVNSLFDRGAKTQKKEVFQALLYCLILKRNFFPDDDITPGIYPVRKLFNDKFSPEIKFNNEPLVFENLEIEFEECLKILIQEIFSEETVFSQTEIKEHCSMCPYKIICHRG